MKFNRLTSAFLLLILLLNCIPASEQDLYLLDSPILIDPTDNFVYQIYGDATVIVNYKWTAPIRQDWSSTLLFQDNLSIYSDATTTSFDATYDRFTIANNQDITWRVKVGNGIFTASSLLSKFRINFYTTVTSTNPFVTTTTLNGPNDGISLLSSSTDEAIKSILITNDNRYLLSGGILNATDGTFSGQTNWGFADILAVKLKVDGQLDTSFGNNGIFIAGGSGTEVAYAMDKAQGGGFYLASYTVSTDGFFASEPPIGAANGYVIKLTEDGVPDTSFSGNGLRVIQHASASDDIRGLKGTSDGGVILVGQTDGTFPGYANQGSNDVMVIKLRSDGNFDTSFAAGGILMFGSTANDIATDVLQTGDGGYLIVGTFGAGSGDFSSIPYLGSSEIFVLRSRLKSFQKFGIFQPLKL